MKKYLVLAMVVSMGTVAGAGLMITGDEGIGDPDFMITGFDNGTVGQAVFMALTGEGMEYVEFIYPGNFREITEFLGVDPDLDALARMMVDEAIVLDPMIIDGPIVSLLFIEFTDGTSTPPSSDGDLALVTLKSPATAFLLNAEDFLVMGTKTYIIPEPMTMALLGLGGLMIRRRRGDRV